MKAATLAACLVAGASFITASAVQAAPQAAPARAAASHAAKPSTAARATASGTIEKFDPATHTLVLKHDGKESTFVLGDNASVMKGKQKAATADIAVGTMAKLEYTVANGTKTVSAVEMSGQAPKPAPARK